MAFYFSPFFFDHPVLGLIKNGILYLFCFRLVSAYQDKVIDRRDKHYAYVTKKLDFQYGGVNFRNFIQMILDDSERQKEWDVIILEAQKVCPIKCD